MTAHRPTKQKPAHRLQPAAGVVPTPVKEQNVSSIAQPTDKDQAPRTVPALCCECGEIRTASVRYIYRGTQYLKCAHCRRRTVHAGVGAWTAAFGSDYREKENAAATERLAELARYEEQLTNEFSIAIETHDGGHSECYVRRHVDPEPWWAVSVSGDLSPVERLAALKWAWREIGSYRVTDGPMCDDGHGDGRYQGFYANHSFKESR